MSNPTNTAILLERSKTRTIIYIDGLLGVHSIDDKSDRANMRRYISFDYAGGESVRVYYGSDDNYHGRESTAADNRDKDFESIKNILQPMLTKHENFIWPGKA